MADHRQGHGSSPAPDDGHPHVVCLEEQRLAGQPQAARQRAGAGPVAGHRGGPSRALRDPVGHVILSLLQALAARPASGYAAYRHRIRSWRCLCSPLIWIFTGPTSDCPLVAHRGCRVCASTRRQSGTSDRRLRLAVFICAGSSRPVFVALAVLTSSSSREKRDTARCGASIAGWMPLHRP